MQILKISWFIEFGNWGNPEIVDIFYFIFQKDTDTIMTGLIAQEVKEAIDKSGVERFGGWDEDTDGIQQIKKELFVFPLINAVKELTAKVKELEKKLEG